MGALLLLAEGYLVMLVLVYVGAAAVSLFRFLVRRSELPTTDEGPVTP